MNIKEFDFPSFENWKKSKYKWKSKIGEHWCEISIVSSGENTILCICAISSHDQPFNIYAENQFRYSSGYIDYKKESKLKLWYDDAIQKANTKWVEYVQNQYLI